MTLADKLLYDSLLSGHPDAPRRVADAYLPRLRSLLKRQYLFLPIHWIEDAAVDAVLFLISRPDRYIPERGSLINYLIRIAGNKLIDQIRLSQRDKVEFVGGTVELALVEAKQYVDGATADILGDQQYLSEEFEALLETILPDAKDRAVCALIQQGRGETSAYAAALGLSHLSPHEQRVQVKRHRDRILKKLQRHRGEFRELLL